MSRATQISDLATRIGQECKALWTAVNGKASTTDPRLSDQRTPTDDSVTTAKLAASGKAVVAMSGFDVDFDAGLIFTKTLTAAGTLTFSNLQTGVKYMIIHPGGFGISAPAWLEIRGTYDISGINLITFLITNATPGSEEGVANIN